MNPLVSVIIPLYNGERFLAEALDSVRAQDYGAVEVVVMDDGSTDSGPGIVRSRGIEVLRHDRKGVAAARNAAVARSNGAILAFLDQDDLWLPSKLTRQADDLQAHPGAVSFVRNRFFLEKGSSLPRWFGKPELLETDSDGYSPSCMAVTRETFGRVGPFDEGLTQAGDLDWIARARHLGLELRVVPELLALKRVHEENESAKPRTVAEMFEAMRRSAARRRESHGTGEAS